MQDQDSRQACGDPTCERSLLPPEAACWGGLPLMWVEASPHVAQADLVVERNALVLMDSGCAQVDYGFGLQSLSCDLRAGSIGYFAQGTHLRASRWRWAPARRIAIDLQSACEAEPMLSEQFQRAPCTTEMEFHDAELAALVRGMAREAAHGSPNGRLFAESLSLGVMLRLQQRAAARHRRSRERGRLTAAQLQAVDDLVRSSLGRQISLGMLAQASGFSPAQFVRLFKNTVGCTPHQYVLRMRLERARDLVLATVLPLAVIADETGFSSQSHMTSAFVRALKTPPGEMRRQGRVRG